MYMSEEAQVNPTQETKNDTIESNLSKQRKMYERQLNDERLARQQAEERIAALERASQERSRKPIADDEDDQEDNEPYVDRRKLSKELNKFQANMEKTIDQKAEAKAAAMIEVERKHSYLRENSDFEQVMNPETIEKFAQKHPRLAENILRMPDGFERQKLVYENIKALGVDKPEQKQSSVQEKIDANKRSPYYQPSGVGSAPYAAAGDYSDSGQKNAYDKMQELKKRLRI
jgi:translation elongation factor P/translation initiation factor 5A